MQIPNQAQTDLQVPVQFKTRAAVAWVYFCLVLGHVVGVARAQRWAQRGFWRLARWKLGGKFGGRWHKFDPDLVREQTDAE